MLALVWKRVIVAADLSDGMFEPLDGILDGTSSGRWESLRSLQRTIHILSIASTGDEAALHLARLSFAELYIRNCWFGFCFQRVCFPVEHHANTLVNESI